MNQKNLPFEVGVSFPWIIVLAENKSKMHDKGSMVCYSQNEPFLLLNYEQFYCIEYEASPDG